MLAAVRREPRDAIVKVKAVQQYGNIPNSKQVHEPESPYIPYIYDARRHLPRSLALGFQTHDLPIRPG